MAEEKETKGENREYDGWQNLEKIANSKRERGFGWVRKRRKNRERRGGRLQLKQSKGKQRGRSERDTEQGKVIWKRCRPPEFATTACKFSPEKHCKPSFSLWILAFFLLQVPRWKSQSMFLWIGYCTFPDWLSSIFDHTCFYGVDWTEEIGRASCRERV